MRKAMKMKVKARATKHKRKPRVFNTAATGASVCPDTYQENMISTHELNNRVAREYMIDIHKLEDKITELEKQLQDAKTERARFLRIIEGMAGVHDR